MGRRSKYTITKEDSIDITDFKEWVENVLKRNATEKHKSQIDDFDYDGLSNMFDFSLIMEKEEKVASVSKQLIKEKVSSHVMGQDKSITADISHIYSNLEEMTGRMDKEEVEYDDFEK